MEVWRQKQATGTCPNEWELLHAAMHLNCSGTGLYWPGCCNTVLYWPCIGPVVALCWPSIGPVMAQ